MGVVEEPTREQSSALVRAAQAGDRAAFDSLVRLYRHRVFALALHMSGSATDADDITQDAFVRAYRRIHSFEGRSEFFTWLYRITLNLALNARRDAGRRRGRVRLSDDRVQAAVAVDSDGDPRHTLELREQYGLLVDALDRLSAPLRTTVVLVALQGLSYKEAAVVLGTSDGTIAWRIHEARAQLVKSIAILSREPTPLPRHKKMSSAEELMTRFILKPAT